GTESEGRARPAARRREQRPRKRVAELDRVARTVWAGRRDSSFLSPEGSTQRATAQNLMTLRSGGTPTGWHVDNYRLRLLLHSGITIHGWSALSQIQRGHGPKETRGHAEPAI